jgi:hypothetical protein
MSVLLKRSPWAIPASALLLGVLLSGCSGGDEGGALVRQPINVTIPAAFTPQPRQATNPAPIPAGQGGTVTATNAGQGGISGVTVQVPVGTLASDITLAVEVVPTAEGIIQKIRATDPNAAPGVTPIAEISFGVVDPTGNIDTNNPLVLSGTAQIQISPDLINQAKNDPNIVVVVMRYNPTTGRLEEVGLVTNATLRGLETDPTTGTITVTVPIQTPGEYVVAQTTVPVHLQGSILP